MSDPSLLIVGPPRAHERRTTSERRGRKPMYGDRASKRCEFVLTPEQRSDLQAMSKAERRPVSAIVRDAVNSYVGDYQERRLFVANGKYLPE